MQVIGVGACGLELLAFSAVTLYQKCRRELNGPDEHVNTDELRLRGEIHVKALNHVVNRFWCHRGKRYQRHVKDK